MNTVNLLVSILVIASVTFLTRAFPFLFLRGSNPPALLTYLGKYAPISIITILIIYSLKDINISAYPFGLNELIAICLVTLFHLKFKNFLLSILGATFVYMFLIQLNFLSLLKP